MKLNLNEYKESLCPVNLRAFNMFGKYKKDSNTFIECGCHLGKTCEKAVYLGYKNIHSCDINSNMVNSAKALLSQYDVNYKIEDKNSEDFLNYLLPKIKEKSTLWLDAHGPNVPIFDELEIIKNVSYRNDHSILIDDIQIYFSQSINELKEKILEINPKYTFEYDYLHHDDKSRPDVLIAHVL